MANNQQIEVSNSKVYTSRLQGNYFAIGVGVLLVIIVVLGLVLFNHNSTQDKSLVVVGEETIYQSDLDYEVSLFPNTADKKELRESLLNKLIDESVILQAGRDEKITTLDQSFFNSQNKDYKKRYKVVSTVKDEITARSSYISGELITVWFYNNEPSEFGYEKGKEIAKTKIDSIYKEVTEKKITMLQAKEKLLSDPDIKKLDPSAYQSNVYMEFKDISPGQKITADNNFDSILHKTKINTFTPVVGIKGKARGTNGEVIDLLYAFGYIYKRDDQSQGKTFDIWLLDNKGKYAVKK